MLPMASSSLSMSSSSSSATVAVDKATSDLLISPDWTMNIDICDSVNSHHWQAKDVVKALKRRLQHKNPKVQLLALTLLETMVKNCGDYLHFQVAERNILGEMIKIVKKKTDMQVREKILVLLDSWQEAFGGPGGKHTQYYWAYEELRRSGVDFPKRSLDASPIFTPPPSHPSMGRPQPGYGMPSNASRRLDETMATEIESLSIEAMQNVSELLFDMLQAVNPSDRAAVKDEVIVELVNRCRTNQKKLMQMLTSTGDEELLARGLDLNDSLQVLLARHDAIASGSQLPLSLPSSSPPPAETNAYSPKQSEARDSAPRDVSPRPSVVPSVPVTTTMTRTQTYEDEEEDEFAQLARRHSKAPSAALESKSNGATTDNLAIVSIETFPSTETASSTSNALALRDPPAPAKSKEQDIIDMLSITLTTTEASTNAPLSPTPNRNVPPVSPDTGYSSQTYSGVQTQAPNSGYVVPWAQPPKQMHAEARPNHSSGYIPPPWASTPGYYTNATHFQTNNTYATHANTTTYTPGQGNVTTSNNTPYLPAQANNIATSSYTPAHTARPLQNGFTVSSGESPAQRPFVPSYRLFEDLNVFGGPSGNAAGTSGQSMVGGRK